ncbi:extracellular solute-binding protein [Streptomyces sp. NPDC088341]|uniref:extracellular solute-binding protein n=1 Tax=Streptomyces sp. NPDC088341 TaxID=3154870 RepID=UPI003430205F
MSRTTARLGALALALLLAGWQSPAQAAPRPAADRTLTVWLMWGSVPQPLVADLESEFEAAHPGVDVTVTLQDWGGIHDRLEQALGSDSAPDVVETGTTETPYFASAGLLADLSAQAPALGQDEWIPALRASGAWQGRQYGVPLYAASRVVVYRKDLFERARLSPPRDQREWLATTRALGRAHRADPDFQPIYLPGQNWYFLSGLLWDRGGDLATRDETTGEWRGGLATPQAGAALRYYGRLQAWSTAPVDQDEGTPPQYEVLARGQVGQLVGMPWELADAERINPELRGKLAMFPVPGLTRERAGSSFLGGTHLAVAARTRQPELALDWVSRLTGTAYQTRLAVANGTLPNRQSLAEQIDDPAVRAQAAAAENGRTTPVDPRWPAVEAAPNPIKVLLTASLTGEPPRAAGRRADRELERRLNQGAP